MLPLVVYVDVKTRRTDQLMPALFPARCFGKSISIVGDSCPISTRHLDAARMNTSMDYILSLKLKSIVMPITGETWCEQLT